MRITSSFSSCLVVLLACGLFPAGARALETSLPATNMPDRVYEVLRAAIQAHWGGNEFAALKNPYAPKLSFEAIRATNLTALAILRQMPGPDLDQLERVRYRSKPSGVPAPKLLRGAWARPATNEQLVLLMADFQLEWQIRSQTPVYERADYARELAELLRVLRRQTNNPAPEYEWRAMGYGEERLPLEPGAAYGHAYGAAWRGETNAARVIMAYLLQADPGARALWARIDNAAQQGFAQGLKLLREGAARSKVLALWEENLRVFPQSPHQAQLAEYVAQLKTQVAEFGPLAATTVEDPESLPVARRAEYYLARFPDCAPPVVGLSGIPLKTAVEALGREAIPALLARLEDRRLTRLTGPRGSYGGYGTQRETQTIWRVQDLALECLEKAAGVRFLTQRREPGLFSTLAPEARAAVAKEARQWWEQSGQVSPVAGQFARLETLPLTERISTAQKLREQAPGATNYVALLLGWSHGAPAYELERLAEVLAGWGDLTLLPRLRELWLANRPNADFILRYGTPEDFGLLRDAERRQRVGSPGSNPSLVGYRLCAEVRRAAQAEKPLTNLFLVPLLAEGLGLRSQTESRLAAGRGSTRCSAADLCLEGLIQLTGHNEGYDATQPVPERMAAVDRWQAWWKTRGRAEFLAQQPETRPAFGTLADGPATVTARDLPALVPVDGADGRTRNDVPRRDLLALLDQRQAEGERAGDLWRFRFTSAEAERDWFRKARPVPAARPGESCLEKLAEGRSILVELERQGRPWVSVFDREDGGATDLRAAVEKAGRESAPVVRGARVLLADRQDRVWLLQNAARTLLAYDARAGKWLERASVIPGTETAPAEDPYARSHFSASAYESRDGALYFAEGAGLHVLAGREWSFQPVERRTNATTGKLMGRIMSWRFEEDAQGRVYAFAARAYSGQTACWRREAGRWSSYPLPADARALVPRAGEEVWYQDENYRWYSFQAGQAPRLLTPADFNLEGEALPRVTLLAVSPTGEAWYQWQPGTNRSTRAGGGAVVVPPAGAARRLGGELSAHLSGQRLAANAHCWAPDGTVWTQDSGLQFEQWNAEGRRLATSHLPTAWKSYTLQIRAADARGKLYLQTGEALWRFDTRSPLPVESDTPLVPGQHYPGVTLALPDSEGNTWLCQQETPNILWQVPAQGPWRKVYEHTGRGSDFGYRPTVQFGLELAQGGMVFGLGENNGFLLCHDGKTHAALDLPGLLRSQYRLMSRLLPGPRELAERAGEYGSLFLGKDGRGNLWWADHRQVGVVNEQESGRLENTSLAAAESTYFSPAALSPGAEAGATVLDARGRTVILTLTDGRLEKKTGPVLAAPRHSYDYERGGPSHLRDRQGRLWVTDRTSTAYAADGRKVLTQPGYVMFEDRAGGVWFREPSSGSSAPARVVRLGAGQARAVWEGGNPVSAPCQGPDDTVWLMEGKQLTQLKYSNTRLQVLNQYPQAQSYGVARLWLDNAGRLWVAPVTSVGSSFVASCLAVRAR